jgi:glycogen operon protein
MLQAGDELGRSQLGNNNAYCQDNEISWVDWGLAEKNGSLIDFVRKLTGLRHKYPVLRRSRFLTGEYIEELGVKDVTWINANGGPMEQEHWEDTSIKCFGMLLDGRAQRTGIRKHGDDDTVLIVLNGYEGLVDFTLPQAALGSDWSLLIDTNIPDAPSGQKFKFGEVYQVTGRSLLLLVLDLAKSAA